jgi:ABC-type uncharacterized transport system ATPase subunit
VGIRLEPLTSDGHPEVDTTVPDRHPATTALPPSQVASVKPLITLSGITRRFGTVIANQSVDLNLWRGEVHGLLGENGAGKSTLMAILSGVLAPDEGSIFIRGDRVAIDSPRAALELGIGMVHQQFRLFDGFTVAENLFVGWNGIPGVHRGRGSLRRRARELCERYGIDLRPDAQAWQLSVGEKQRLEILRMLIRDVDVLILDEPTAVLTFDEAARLFDLLDALKRRGKAIVFITHKLQEVIDTADRITVMRKGLKSAEMLQSEASIAELTRLMIGTEIHRLRRDRLPPEDPVLVLREVSASSDYGLPALQRINLTVRAREILGIAGVAGNGQRELIEILAGLRCPTAGEITMDGKPLRSGSPLELIRAGVGIVPEERNGTGLAPLASIWENSILRQYRSRPLNRRGFISQRAAKDYALSLARRVRLSTANVNALAKHLSGGNAQRLLVGRELDVASRALVLAYPTRGLDVAAVAELHAALADARERGLAILVVSEDLDELFDLCDRIAVLYSGQVVAVHSADQVDRVAIGRLMAGMTSGDSKHTLGSR